MSPLKATSPDLLADLLAFELFQNIYFSDTLKARLYLSLLCSTVKISVLNYNMRIATMAT